MGTSRSATIDDVAAAAGVSRAAVSKVIRNAYGVSPAMRERVATAIETLDYRPRTAARALRGKNFTIGFAIPQMGNDFLTQLINGALAALTGTGYQLIIAPDSSEVPSTKMLDALEDRQVDGIISVSPVTTPEWLERFASRVQLVSIGRHHPSLAYDTVTGDDHAGAELVMDHLFELGHQRIVHLTGDYVRTSAKPTDPHGIRLETYFARMHEHGLDPVVARTGPAEEQAAAVTAELIASADRPTAIFAGNDTLAIGALRAIDQAQTDIAVVGYDDIMLASHPKISLTTVDQFGPEMGGVAARLLMERMAGRTDAVHHQVQPVLRVRDSTFAAPKSRSERTRSGRGRTA